MLQPTLEAEIEVCVGGIVTYKEGDEDGGVHHNQGENGSPAIAETIGDRSGSEDTDESATLARLEEGTLPLGRNGIFAVDEDTISLLESGEGDKVTVQEHVERLHDLQENEGTHVSCLLDSVRPACWIGVHCCSKRRTDVSALKIIKTLKDEKPGVNRFFSFFTPALNLFVSRSFPFLAAKLRKRRK